MKDKLESILCQWCYSTLTEEYHNQSFVMKCCNLKVCNSCMLFFTKEIQTCMQCHNPIEKGDTGCYTRDNTTATKLEKILMKS